MGLKAIKIENHLGYSLNPNREKRKSHKLYKMFRNRKQRRKINADLEYIPQYNLYTDFEY